MRRRSSRAPLPVPVFGHAGDLPLPSPWDVDNSFRPTCRSFRIVVSRNRRIPLIYLVLASVTLALVLAVIALVRQVQVRRALEALLRRLLKQWRTRREE